MRYFINLSYLGARFNGWQKQPQGVSVQQTVENALGMLLRKPTKIIGAGRTDAGVNGRMMVAHFDTDEPLTDEQLYQLPRSLSGICRPDIVVYEVFPVHDDAHARFDAVSRTYRYFVHTKEDPFVRDLSCQVSPDIDFDAMNRAGALMLGRRDFTSFSKLHTDTKTNICDLRDASWHKVDETHWYFQTTADRFLRNMVRAIVGTLHLVGTHKIAPEEIIRIIDQKDRCAAGQSMPGHALYLWNVSYPYYNRSDK